MDFSDSPEQASFRAAARAFLKEHAPPIAMVDYTDDQYDDDELFNRAQDWQRTQYEHGWMGLTWPKEYGGRGLGPIEQIIWSQECARVGIGESLFVVGVGMVGPTLIAHGSDAQRERYLDPMLSGDEVWCQLFSEPGAGSDLAALATRAERDGDDWVVSGQKTWCSGAHYARFGILLARTDPSVPKHQGITFFVIDMKSPGVEVRPLLQMNRGSHFNEVFLDGVRIPDQNLVGEAGGGWKVAMTTLMSERMSMGGFDRMFSFDDFVAHAREHSERVDDVMRDEIGRLYCELKEVELLNASVITQLSRGKLAVAESSVMKLAIARMISRAAELGIRLEGPGGMQRRGFWQNLFLMAPALHIAGGTDEVQKNICAERVLGLPREPSPDKDLPFDQLPRS